MSKFSNYLRKLIDQSGESIASISRNAGIERTSIHKALKDERILSYKAMQILARYFGLCTEERQEFFRLHDISLQGEDAYENRQAVCDFLNTLASVDFSMFPPPKVNSLPLTDSLINGEYAVRSIIRSVLIYEVSHHTDVEIQMFLPEKLDLTMEFMELWLNENHFSVSELLYLHRVSTLSPNPARRNLKKLGSYYRNFFQTKLQNCDLLIQCSSNIMEVLQEYIAGTSPDTMQVFMSQPCPGRYITPAIIKKYLNSNDMPYHPMYELVEQHFSVLRQDQITYLTVFTEKGLSDLTQTCVLQDMPPQYVPPLDPDDIRQMLKTLYKEISDETISGLILRPTHLQLPDYLTIYVTSTGIHIYTTNAFVFGAYCCNIHIQEHSLCKIFSEFIKNLPGSPLVYTKEETLNLLKQYIALMP